MSVSPAARRRRSLLLLMGGPNLRAGLTSFWRLEEASGTRVDAHGANHLTDKNTVTQAAGKHGSAASFAAASFEDLEIADNAALSFGDTDFSVAGWAYLNTLTAHRTLFGKFNATGNQREAIVQVLSTGSYRVLGSSNGTALDLGQNLAGITLATATWYFFAFVHDAARNLVTLRVNGTAQQFAHSLGLFDGTAPFKLGDYGGLGAGGEPHDGRLDSVGFWRRALAAEDLDALYNGGAGLDYPGL